jgi:hypothetical protein
MTAQGGQASEADGRGADPISAVIGEFIGLMLQHGTLARAEMSGSAASFGLAVLFALAALLIGFLGLTLLLTGVALGLAEIVPPWAAFLLVGTAVVLAAGALWWLSRARLRRCTLLPRRAITSLRDQLVYLAGLRP